MASTFVLASAADDARALHTLGEVVRVAHAAHTALRCLLFIGCIDVFVMPPPSPHPPSVRVSKEAQSSAERQRREYRAELVRRINEGAEVRAKTWSFLARKLCTCVDSVSFGTLIHSYVVFFFRVILVRTGLLINLTRLTT
jgi:hypothetical protein